MKKPITALCLAASLTGLLVESANAQQRRQPGTRRSQPIARAANPGAVVAAEVALSQASQKHGEWKAMERAATNDAVVFAPDVTPAKEWLHAQNSGPQSLKIDPFMIFSSCDGATAAALSNWQRSDGVSGQSLTIWERERGKGYRWAARMEAPASASDRSQSENITPEANDGFTLRTISSTIAECSQNSALQVRPRSPRDEGSPAQDTANRQAFADAVSAFLTKQQSGAESADDDAAQPSTSDAVRFGGAARDGTLLWGYVLSDKTRPRPLVAVATDNGWDVIAPLG